MLLRWAIAALALLAATAAQADAPWVPDRVVVRFAEDGPHALRDCAETLTRQGRRLAPATADGSDSLDRLHARLGVRGVRALFRRPDARPFAEQRRRLRERLAGRRRAGALPDLAHVYLVELPERGDVVSAVALYRADPHVVYAQPDYRVEAGALEDGLPDDRFFASAGSWGQPYPDLWGLHRIRAPEAWSLARGEGALVAVNDSGLDYEHPDIAANVWVNPGEDLDGNGIADDADRNGLDDDGNGFVDDFHGFDFNNSLDADENGDYAGPDDVSDSDPFDDNGHGTHVAGTVAAVADNGIGVLGVAPRARVMALKGLDAQGSGATSDLARGIVYAAANGARAVNNSWSCSARCPSNPVAEDAVRVAHGLGVVLVFSAGNRADEVAFYSPQNMRETLTVAATNPADEAAAFSNRGFLVDVAAPGAGLPDPPPEASPQSGVLSLRSSQTSAALDGNGTRVVEEDYLRLAGTSMAAPHVTGLVALILSQRPELTPDQVRTLLRMSAEDLGTPGHDPRTGAGRIDAARALALDPPELRAEIAAPAVLETLRLHDTVAEIVGSAGGPDFAEYRVFVGSGAAPEAWIPLGPARTAPVEGGPLAAWSLAGLAEGAYVIRLATGARDGSQLEAFAPVSLERNPPRLIGALGPIDSAPSVSGRRVVWQSFTSDPDGNPVWNLFGVDLGDPELLVQPIVVGSEDATGPDLSGDRLVWQRSGERPIHGATCLLSSEAGCEPRPLGTGAAARPAVSGDRIVWQGSALLYCEVDAAGDCDGQPLATGLVSEPAIDGTRVVWSRGSDLVSCTVAPDASACVPRGLGLQPLGFVDSPALSGELLAWQSIELSGHSQIQLCELAPSGAPCTPITVATGSNLSPPDVSGNRVVWHAAEADGNPEVFFCEYERETRSCPAQRLTSSPHAQLNPVVDGDWVLWEDQRMGTFAAVFGFELPSLDPLSERGVEEGGSLVVEVAGRDPLGDAVALAARQSNGEPLAALGAVFDDLGDGRGRLRWEPDFTQAGSYAFRIELTTVGGLRTARTLHVEVADVNRPPRIAVPRRPVARVGEALVLDACASTDPDGDALHFAWRDRKGAALGSDCTLVLPARSRPGVVRVELELSDGLATQQARIFARWLPDAASAPRGPRAARQR